MTESRTTITATILLCFVFSLCFLASPAATHAAVVEFTYTGNNYSHYTGPYAPEHVIQATFSLDVDTIESLPFGNFYSVLHDKAITMNDGVRTLSMPNGDPNFFRGVHLGTDGQGNITQWLVEIDTINAAEAIFTSNYHCPFHSTIGNGPCDFTSTNNTPLAYSFEDPGTWEWRVVEGELQWTNPPTPANVPALSNAGLGVAFLSLAFYVARLGNRHKK